MQKEENRWTIYNILGGEEDTAEKQEQSREHSYRRGWHQGWVYAVDIIFGKLQNEDISIGELYRQIARFENREIMSWRQDLSILPVSTPDFVVIPEPVDHDADEDDEEIA